FTLFSGPTKAVAEMRKRRRAIGSVLKRIANCEEWGVRITRVASSGAASRSAAQPAEMSGVEFLRAKKAARDDARDAARIAAEAPEGASGSLASLARDTRRRDDAPPGAPAPPLLDAAFLVLVADRPRFRTAARKAAAACAGAGAGLT